MCSATQEGLRVRRSKALARGRLVTASATGPGKPYWNRPAGSTGDVVARDGASAGDWGCGAGNEVVVVVVVVVVVGDERRVVEGVLTPNCCWRFLEEYMKAVTPAPVAALAAAITANVALDMMYLLCIFFLPSSQRQRTSDKRGKESNDTTSEE